MLGHFRDKEADKALATHYGKPTMELYIVDGKRGYGRKRCLLRLASSATLGFCYGRQDRKHELGDTVASHIAAKIDHVERDTNLLELSEDIESIKR